MECSIILLLVTVGFLCEYTGADSPTNQPNEKKIEEMNATIIQLQGTAYFNTQWLLTPNRW